MLGNSSVGVRPAVTTRSSDKGNEGTPSLDEHYKRQLRILLDRLDAHENCRHEDCHARHELRQFVRMISGEVLRTE